MVTYNDADDALELADDDRLKVGDYELGYDSALDEWQAEYRQPIGGESGNHGEIRSGQYSSDSKVGQYSMEFNGTSGHILVPDKPEIVPSAFESGISVSFWAHVKSNKEQTIVGRSSGTDNDTFHITLRENESDSSELLFHTYFDTDDGSLDVDGADAPLDQWVHFTLTCDFDTVTMYIDGVSAYEDTTTFANATKIISGGSPLSIGSRGGDMWFFDGNVDDIRLYNRAVSSSEASDIYNGVDVTDGLLARYDFEYPETPRVAIDSTGDAFPKNTIPKNTSGSFVPRGLAESVAEGKALADDGEMYDTVQAAVDAASGWVFVGPGTFNENVSITTNGLTLEGCGNGTLIDGGTSGNAINVSSANTTVKNISVQTTSIGIDCTADSITIENVNIRESDGHAINSTSNATNLTINNCTVDIHDSNAGIDIQAEWGKVINNSVLDSGPNADNNIRVVSDNCIISGNISNNAGTDGIVIASSDNIIVGNRIDNAGRGINMFSGSDNIIANNRVSDSTNDDISDSGTGTVLDDNLTGASN